MSFKTSKTWFEMSKSPLGGLRLRAAPPKVSCSIYFSLVAKGSIHTLLIWASIIQCLHLSPLHLSPSTVATPSSLMYNFVLWFFLLPSLPHPTLLHPHFKDQMLVWPGSTYHGTYSSINLLVSWAMLSIASPLLCFSLFLFHICLLQCRLWCFSNVYMWKNSRARWAGVWILAEVFFSIHRVSLACTTWVYLLLPPSSAYLFLFVFIFHA